MDKCGIVFPMAISGAGWEFSPPPLGVVPVPFPLVREVVPAFDRLADKVGRSGVIPVLDTSGNLSGLFVPEDVKDDLLKGEIGIDRQTLDAVRDGIFDRMFVMLEESLQPMGEVD